MDKKQTSVSPLAYHNPSYDQSPPHRLGFRWLWIPLAIAGSLILLVLILLPSLGKARETANRVKCSSNLSQIFHAALLYANEHEGQLPPDFPTLVLHGELDAQTLICASTDLAPATGATTRQVASALKAGTNLSYAWCASGLATNLQPHVVVAFDLDLHLPRDNAPGKGVNVLLGDGTVVFVDHKTARQIKKQYDAGMRPIRFPSE